MLEKRYYTVKELQEILGGSHPTVYSLVNNKVGSQTAIFSEVKKVKRTRSATAGRFLFGKEV